MPALDVSMQLSFALYSAANRMARLHKPFLEPMGLTFPQYLVLLELFANAPQSVGQIGAKLGMDTGTITPLLKRMEAGGSVARRRDPSDERRVLVTLTQAGEKLRDPVWSVTEQIKTACALNKRDLSALRDTLSNLAMPADQDAGLHQQ
ncbi:MAG: MarR family transcriptional regulator [Hyphomicrobiales bacterium]|nr:MAG: MarR family transcriptional regulator [Hyphomicrobiales bacterium]